MSWTRITGKPEQPLPIEACWAGGYLENKWNQTKAIYRRGVWYTSYTGQPVSHPITDWAPFEAPEPPPPMSAREAVEKALEHLDTWWEQGGHGDSEIMSAKVLLRIAIAREEADAQDI